MRNTRIAMVLVAAGLSAGSMQGVEQNDAAQQNAAQQSPAQQASSPVYSGPRSAVREPSALMRSQVRFADLIWEKGVYPDGVTKFEYAIVSVDDKTKATTLFLRMEAGSKIPAHHHPANEQVLVLAGGLYLSPAQSTAPTQGQELAQQRQQQSQSAGESQALQEELPVAVAPVQQEQSFTAANYGVNDLAYVPAHLIHEGKALPGEDLLLYIQSEGAWGVLFD
jgi:hypothetical protein